MATSDKANQPKAPPAASQDHSTPPAQHIWLAGLGAMAKAQEQGSKAIEALVNDGLAFQRKSQAEAQQQLHEATERLSHMASGFGQSASVRVDKLEHLFEDRVAKALHRLGIPSVQDIQLLTARVTQLEAQVKALSPQAAPVAAQPQAKTQAKAPGPSAQAKPPKPAKPAKPTVATPAKTRRKSS
ncbi:MAG: phasin family protein [Pseudomonadota bacterium]